MRDVHPVRRKARFGSPTYLFAAILLLASASQAAVVTVTTTVDENDGSCADGDCSLGDAVATAAAGDTVDVPAGTYVLTLGTFVIDKQLTIQGAGARVTIVDGNANGRIFTIPSVGGNPTVTITGLTITNGNTDFADSEGGGVRNEGTLVLRNCTISNNVSFNGAGIFSTGTLTVDRCAITGNTSSRTEGGGVRNLGGTATIVNSTISGNTVEAEEGGSGIGGGVSNEQGGILALINSTITQNTANESGGLFSKGNTVQILNTIIAENSSPFECDVTSTTTSSSHSLDSDNTCLLTGTGDLPNTNPELDPLANNGGPTDTHALQEDSPALDAGDDATCAAAPVNGVDQRGVARPQAAHCDIGAFELVQNQSPDCSAAEADPDDVILPLLITFVSVEVDGVTDADGDPISITITSIRQDEPVGLLHPDGTGVGGSTAYVRAEANLLGNGRVYHIGFTASDGEGGTCNGTVKTGVRLLFPAVDNGSLYNSTL